MPPTIRALLLTDLVDSTRLVETLGDARAAEIFAAHDRVARDLLPPHRGREIDRTDGFLLLFEGTRQAAAYAVAYHQAVTKLGKELDIGLSGRAGIHEGEVILRENPPEDVARGAKPLEVEGIAKPTAARIMALALGGQTLLSEPARAALHETPQGWEIQSHVHYRLKGMAEPMELFEVGTCGESPFAPPADTAKAYRVVRAGDLWRPAREIRHSLPAERDAFVGRSEELHDLAARLDEGERLVTVLGMGGTGKTRYVRRYGWTWLGDWPGGVYFCDLSEARSLDGIVSGVAGALDVPLGKDDPVVQLGHAIAGRGKCLVILDNFEQVCEHAQATVGRWLERAASASFMVTSRERLLIPGEHVMPLEPLPTDGAGVELFVVRAQAQRPDFMLTPANEPAVREIVTLLDGLPLAIELAAARTRMLSPEQLLVRLRDRFQILVGARGVQARQSTLRAAIDWSWTLLAPWEQAALAQASVFVGGFTLEAAESVLDLSAWPEAPRAMDVVQALLDKSLLRTWTPGAGQRLAIDEPYFGMYVSIHEYAAEKLRVVGALPDGAGGAAAERAAFERHGRHFARLGSEETIAALDTHGGAARHHALALELENLVAACRRAVGRADGPTAAATFAAASSVLLLKGPLFLAAELGTQVLGLGTLTPADRARALQVHANALRLAGRMDEARKDCEEALVLARQVGNRRLEGSVLANLGVVSARQGRMEEALRHFEEGLAIHREVGNRGAEGSVLGNLGLTHAMLGHVDESLRQHLESLAIHREVGNRRTEGSVLSSLASLHRRQGRMAEALRYYQEALAIARALGHRGSEGAVLSDLGSVHANEGRPEEARRHYQEGLAIHREVGNRVFECVLLGSLGLLDAMEGRVDEALRHDHGCLALARAIGNRHQEGATLSNLGSLHAGQGRMQEALCHYQAGLAIHRDVGNRGDAGATLGGLGLLHAMQGRMEEAREALAEGEALLRTINDRVRLGQLHCQRGECERLAGDVAAARAQLAGAEALAQELAVGPNSELGRAIAKLRASLDEMGA
jgi:predicted ATPase/class 3 adenylate cyclase/Tfp pilus assembly protein PilF